MSISLAGQVALVVGASSGIGRSIATHFSRDGALVVASARREERLRELRQEMTADNCALEIYAADATQPDEMEALARFAKAQFGKIDILVYATGTNTPDRAMSRLNVPI